MSQSARSMVLIALFRVTTYQLVVVACQQASGLLIAVLLAAELSKTIYLAKTYSLFKHIKHISYFAAEMTQSMFLIVFLFLAFILHLREKGEDVPERYQRFGIWLVMIAIIVEWIFTFTSIVQAIIEPFLLRSKGLESVSNIAIVNRNIPTTSNKPQLQAGQERQQTNSIELKTRQSSIERRKSVVESWNEGDSNV